MIPDRTAPTNAEISIWTRGKPAVAGRANGSTDSITEATVALMVRYSVTVSRTVTKAKENALPNE